MRPVNAGAAVVAEVDPDRMAQVLDNLLDNAISYAGEGAVVEVGIEDGETVTLTVSDNGRGVPKEHLAALFDPFYRADSARTPSEGHSGLGLSISRALVSAHGGELTLESEQGVGTKAVVILPRKPGSALSEPA